MKFEVGVSSNTIHAIVDSMKDAVGVSYDKIAELYPIVYKRMLFSNIAWGLVFLLAMIGGSILTFVGFREMFSEAFDGEGDTIAIFFGLLIIALGIFILTCQVINLFSLEYTTIKHIVGMLRGSTK